MERNSFIFYKGWREAIKDLPDDVRLEIYESIIEYATTGNLRGLKPMANIAFNFIKIDIDRDTEKYMSIVERNKSNGSKGGRPKSENPKEPKEPTKPTGLFGNPKEPTKPDNDNEYDNDYVDDNDSHLKKKETSPKGESKKDELSLPTPLYFKPNFLKADSLAFALSCDRILDLLFALSSMLIMASSSSDLVNDR